MVPFLLRRLIFGLLVLGALSFVSFCFFASQPGTEPSGDPVLHEFWAWVKGLVTGSSLDAFITPRGSRLNHQPTTIIAAFGHTAALLSLAFVFVLVLGLGLALLAASRRGSVVDVVLRALSYLAWGIPAFLLALLVQKLANGASGSHGVGPFPLAGWPGSCPAGLGVNAGTIEPCASAGGGAHYALNVLRYVTLPALTIALAFVGLHGRYLRASLIDALDAPYVAAARAKGLSERRLLVGHALSVVGGVSLAGLLADFGAVFGAAMAVDYVFELNGLGTVFVNLFPLNSFSPIDTYAVQAVLIITGILVIVSSTLSEVALIALDPRIRADR